MPSLGPRKSRRAVLPGGVGLDGALGRFLGSPSELVFHPPLGTPGQELRRRLERERAAASESFSAFESLLGVERLLRALGSPDSSPISPSALCALLRPLVCSALWRLAPSVRASVGQTLVAHHAVWDAAVRPLSAQARTAILLRPPWDPAFGSAEEVAAASSRQVEVLLRDGRSGSGTSGRAPLRVGRPGPSRRPSRPFRSTSRRARPPLPSRGGRSGSSSSRGAPTTSSSRGRSSKGSSSRPFRASSSGSGRGTR